MSFVVILTFLCFHLPPLANRIYPQEWESKWYYCFNRNSWTL